ncbi:aldehyde dehydrogenase family protein [Amycolatopsis sp. FBCC-B4732]|uniref:aldehyde dehydrogenase family protein n=1 Tax=Amycolatopsis sp. FBCC-B4732 TaxID=3079339 RepID=UPI001FF6293F|nr:aldehyde dehydrogenase family protein [Amycolatopsis sp. FBCC-B4732]UOX90705.1 aldehyde dehydrogenase family protein [Amycolatopsis sp. FBCC-B4732]
MSPAPPARGRVPGTQPVFLGPLINEGQLRGTDEGLFSQPIVLAVVATDMPAFREEIFDPVAYGLVAAVPERGVGRPV